MKRLLTAAVAVPLALLATFKFPPWAFFVFMLLIFIPASLEYVQLLRPLAPKAPLWVVPFAVPAVALAFYWAMVAHDRALPTDAWVLAACTLATVGVGTLLLLGRTPPPEAAAAIVADVTVSTFKRAGPSTTSVAPPSNCNSALPADNFNSPGNSRIPGRNGSRPSQTVSSVFVTVAIYTGAAVAATSTTSTT